jgi:hypothetical protein
MSKQLQAVILVVIELGDPPEVQVHIETLKKIIEDE